MTDFAPALLAETLVMTALLIGAVLLLRRPAAALLGPRFAYALWLVPALRLVLPPLPGGEMVLDRPPPPPVLTTLDLPAEAVLVDGGLAAAPLWPAFMGPALLLLWLAGALAVLGSALVRHHRWERALRRGATALDDFGGVRVMMSDRVDGPVASGLLHPVIIVPSDFFARYSRAERELALAHEVAHHRAGDLWANAAALLVLAAQWFNPLAWAAHRAFRFDQEAACDARVLAELDADRRARSAHSYACAIAKSVAGPRLLLAAPMTSGTKVKERLTMLTHEPRFGRRPLAARLLLGGAGAAALALTMSSLPARIVYAAEPADAPPVSEAPPAPGEPVVKEKRVRHLLMIDSNGDATTVDGEGAADGTRKKVHRIIISDGDGEAKAEAPRVMPFSSDKDGVAAAPHVRMAMPFFGPDKDELRATLKEQGIEDAKVDAIIKSIDKKRAEAREKMRISMVPLIPGNSGFPMTEEAYRNLRQLSVPQVSEKDLLERTLKALTAARDNLVRKSASGESRNPAVVESLDREIEHLKGKIDRL